MLKACVDRLSSNTSGWLSSSVEVVRVYCIIRNDADNCFLFLISADYCLLLCRSFLLSLVHLIGKKDRHGNEVPSLFQDFKTARTAT